MSWTTPGQGYNFNEPLSEGAKEVAKEYPRDREWQKLVRKHSRSIEKFQKTGNFDRKAEEELVSWAMDNGEIRTDDVDETDAWIEDIILNNSYIPEGEPISEGKVFVHTKDPKVFTALQKIAKQTGDKVKKKSGGIEVMGKDLSKSKGFLYQLDKVDIPGFNPNYESVNENLLMEKPYDKADVKKVQKLEIQFEKLIKEVDKTMRGSGLSAPAFSMVRSGPTKGLQAIRRFYDISKSKYTIQAIQSQKESIDEGMMDLEKARQLPDKIQKEIMNAKKEYDRTWDGVFVPMGKEGSSQRKEYERRGALFKAASAKYKALLKRHKVATFK
jgi:hypothetical protein